MKFNVRYLILGILLVISTMVVATQFALSDRTYQYRLPYDPGIWYIGSDNSSDGIRVLRTDQNSETGDLKIVLGNVSTQQQMCYSAAFGIVNENPFCMNIAGITASSSTPTYLKIWLHGDRHANANNLSDDPTSVLLYDNGTIVHPLNKTAWTLASGDNNYNTTCTNITDRP